MASVAAPPAAPRTRNRVWAFIEITKPRIIELLLVTTIPTMIVAERGIPSVWLMINTPVSYTHLTLPTIYSV